MKYLLDNFFQDLTGCFCIKEFCLIKDNLDNMFYFSKLYFQASLGIILEF